MPTFVRYGRGGGRVIRFDVGFAGDRPAATEAVFCALRKKIS